MAIPEKFVKKAKIKYCGDCKKILRHGLWIEFTLEMMREAFVLKCSGEKTLCPDCSIKGLDGLA